MSKRKFALGLFGAGSLFWGERYVLADFVPPTQADPADTYTAAIGVNYNQVQTFTESIHYDSDFDPEPDVYWFKYTSDGKTAVTFDTLGSNFGTSGPGGGSSGSGSGVLGTSGDSEIAVYNSTGKMMAISKGVVDSSGNPVEIARFLNEAPLPNPAPVPLPTDYYYAEELTQLSFKSNATSDPRWDANPNSTQTYTGWVAPDNVGETGQNYAPLNEYHAWSTALSKYQLNNDGSTVLTGGSPVATAGWRPGDYSNLGPASTWNQYRVLPAGVYYIAVSASGIVYSGDTYADDLLQAPIHFDYGGSEPNNGSLPETTAPLGTFQYYDSPYGYQDYGTIQLNVTQTPATLQYQWITDGNSNWSAAANWAGPVPGVAGDTANFLSTNTASRTIMLDAAESVGHLVFDSSYQYTLAGTNTLTLDNGSNAADVIINSGSHVISAPLAVASNTTIIAPATTGLSITGSLAISAGLTLTKDGAGSLTISGIQTNATGSALYIGEGTATISSDPGSNLALTSTGVVTFPANTGTGIRPIHLASISISTAGLTNGSITFAGPGTGNQSKRTVVVTSGINITGTSSIGWTGLLDLSGNDAIVHGGNTPQLLNQVASGFNASAWGNWQGSNGITSSAAAADTKHLTALGVIQNSTNGIPSGTALYTSFDGVAVTDSDVLIKYTYYGDANLDGKVDASDYSKIDSGFLTHATGWFNGDFNYDGTVNGSDYTLIDNAFNTQGAQLASAFVSPLASITSEIAGVSTVPEPTTLSLLAIGAAGLLGRRHRRV